MTRNTRSTDSIDRRTTLGLLTGGLASLAGCIGGSSGPSNESESDSGSGGLLSNENSGWVPPEEQSDYITSSEITLDDTRRNVILDLQFQNSVEMFGVDLVDANGNEYSSSVLDQGTAQLPLTQTVTGPEGATIISPGENTIVLDLGVDDQERIPLRLGTSLAFREVSTDVEGESRNEVPLGILVENTGPHPTTASQIGFSNVIPSAVTDDASDGEVEYEFELIEPGETKPVLIPDSIWRTRRCEEYSQRELGFTLEFLWANSVSVTQSVEYPEPDGLRDCGSTVGSPSTPDEN